MFTNMTPIITYHNNTTLPVVVAVVVVYTKDAATSFLLIGEKFLTVYLAIRFPRRNYSHLLWRHVHKYDTYYYLP